jgi:hypothetical protein
VIERQLHGLYMMAGLCTRTFVKPVAGERFEVLTTQNMSVNLLKDGLMLRTGVPVARQRLLLHGVELTVGKLSDYGNIAGATVLMAEPRRPLVVQALQAVIRCERESTVARLYAELAQTRLERDEAYALFSDRKMLAWQPLAWQIGALVLVVKKKKERFSGKGVALDHDYRGHRGLGSHRPPQ